MKRGPNKRLIQRAIAAAIPDAAAVMINHLEGLSQLSVDELGKLMNSDEGMRKLQGPLVDMEIDPVQVPRFSEVVVAKPGRMTRLEHARVLSGGTRDEWGPALRRKKT